MNLHNALEHGKWQPNSLTAKEIWPVIKDITIASSEQIKKIILQVLFFSLW